MLPRVVRLACLAALLGAGSAAAQKQCLAENESAPWNMIFSTIGRSWVAVEVAVPGPDPVTAIELPLAALPGPGAMTVGVFLSPNGAAPYASAEVSVEAGAALSWYGARLDRPVPPADRIWVGAQLDLASRLVMSRNGSVVKPLWIESQGVWTASASNGLSLPLRVHCGTHQGQAVEYGEGQAGTGGVVPRLRAEGFANTGNTVTLFTARTSPGLAGVVLLGLRGALHNPLLPLHVHPVAAHVPVRTTAFGLGPVGYQLTPLELPLLPSLSGQQLAAQTALLDPGAALGLSGTNGVEITIGH